MQDNFQFLSNHFSHLHIYLNKIIQNKAYKNLDNAYIEIFGKAFSDIDIQGTRFSEVNKLIAEIERFEAAKENSIINAVYEEEDTEDSDDIESTNDTSDFAPQNITDLCNRGESLYIIGDPGSGKSTTLLKILYQNSFRILQGEDLKIPLYLIANEFSESNSFSKMIERNFGNSSIKENLKTGNFIILIDGLNEISFHNKTDGILNIKQLFQEYPLCTFIISERKVAFKKFFDLSVYELTPLSENQIKEFINGYNKRNSEMLWKQLEESKHLMELAYNPLMLKMILVVSNDGKVPSNKGRLYDLFIKTIFEREERKRQQTNIDLKLKIVSKAAFLLRIEGKVSCNKYYFKDLLKRTINLENIKVSSDEFFNELIDNFVIRINDTEDVSFIHESYLEYFVGYSLMTNLRSKNDLGLQLINENWIEPIELCVNLIEEKEAVDQILDYLIRDPFNNIKEPKLLKDFQKNDFNEYIYIPAKIISNYKIDFPKGYKKLEIVVNNYLLLWRDLLSRGIEPIDVDKLFKSVAYINSENIYHKIFTYPSWVSIWLCSDKEIYEMNSNESLNETKDELFKKIATALSQYVTDISIIFKQLDLALIEYQYFNSVTEKIKELRRIIIEKSNYKVLKSYYLNNKNGIDSAIICRLVRENLRDTNLHDFENPLMSGNYKIVRTILEYHHNNIEAIKFVVNEIKLRPYSDKLQKKIIEFIYRKEYLLFTIELIDYNLSRFQDLEDYMIEILQEIEWSNLTKRLQNYLSLKIEGLNFKIIEKTTSHLKIISNEINDRKSQLIFSKGKIIGTEKCIISKIKPLEVLYELIVIQRRKAESFLSDFKIIEIIRLDQVFIFDVIGARISNTNNLVITITQNSPTFIETYQTFNGCKVYQDMKLIGLINSIQTKTSKKILEVNGEIESLEIKDDNLSVNMNSNFILKMLSDSEIRRLKIHPFEIKNSPESMSILLNKLTFNPDNIINFLLKNKLINYFLSKQFYPLNFGLIIAKKEIKLHTIYFVTTKDVVEMKTRNKGNVGDIVVLDNDKKMHKINLNKSVRNFIGFKIGRIINYNDKKGEGFISVKDDSYQGDYFFSKHYTDLIPTVGDKVEFIAIPNPIDRYKGKMVALNITMAENT